MSDGLELQEAAEVEYATGGYLITDPETGELVEVSAAEATAAGYDVGPDGTHGVTATPFAQPVAPLSLPEAEELGAQGNDHGEVHGAEDEA